MKWLKRIGVVVGVLVALLVIVPHFVRLNDHIPALEQEISARIGEPVSIASLRVSILPVPLARADHITIGKADEIRVGKLTLVPDVWSLMRENKVIRSVEMEDLTLPQEALGAIVALTHADRGAGKLRVEKIRLSNAVVKLAKSSFGPFDVDVQVSTQPQQSGHLTLKTRDGTLRTDVTPQGERYLLEIVAKGWTPPLGPALVFEELNVKGVVRAKSGELETIQAKMYGGTVAGKATIAWDKGIAIKGNLDVKQVELRGALATVSPKPRLSGKIDGTPIFSAQAENTAGLSEALKLETSFAVREGVLHGLDLMTAATTLGRSTGEGDTRLNELAGNLRIDGRTYRFSELRISSGPLAVRGAVQVSPSRAISGKLNANANGLGRVTGVPLIVSGTVDSPSIALDARALAGALPGTAIPGPGVDTAAGAKLGDVVEGLFGGSRKR